MLKFSYYSLEIPDARPWKKIKKHQIYIVPYSDSFLGLFPAAAGFYTNLQSEPCVVAFNSIHHYSKDTQRAILLSTIGAIELGYMGTWISRNEFTEVYLKSDAWALSQGAGKEHLATYFEKVKKKLEIIIDHDLFEDERTDCRELLILFTKRLENISMK